MLDECIDYHVERLIKATNDLWREDNSICHKCHETHGKPLNCILCYCPRYNMGTECGGNFVILDNGIKDCSGCTIPHDPTFVKEYLKKMVCTMNRNSIRDNVIRIQGDKLAIMLGMKPGVKVPKDVIDMISRASLGDSITIGGNAYVVSASMKSLVEILTGKGAIEE